MAIRGPKNPDSVAGSVVRFAFTAALEQSDR
jgi:hypothetical protein